MKLRFLLSSLICSLSFFVNGQTFYNNNRTLIPDSNRTLSIQIPVSGLPTSLNSGFGLTKVALKLNHPFIGELTAVLKSPSGQDSIRLLWHDGGNSTINDTLFFTEAANYYIASYPITGNKNYFGEDDNNRMNDGRNPNGTWTLNITDVVLNHAGVIYYSAITFGANPPITHSRIFGCSLLSPWGCSCPDGSNDCDLLPDMTNAELSLVSQLTENATELRFGVATPNIGYGPLEMNGSPTECFCDTTPVVCGTPCPTGQEQKRNVYQKIYHRSGNTMTSYERLAGQMEYHPTHNHIHVDHWTNNTLRIKSRDKNPANWPIIGSSYKISFCLINLGSCDSYSGYCKDTTGNILHTTDIPNNGFGVVSGCSLGQGIYPGKVDEYGASLEGQSITLDSICNGNYYLVSITDPDNTVKELNDNNNWAITPVKLMRRPCNNCKANFYADTLHGIDSLTVKFSDSTIAIPERWLWDFGDGTNDTVQFPTHNYTTPGIYTVKLKTFSATCSDSVVKSNYIIVEQSPAPPVINGITITAMPNPFKGDLSIKFETPENMNTSIEIFDAIGKLINVMKTDIHSGITYYKVEKAKFGSSNGIYFIRIHFNGKYKTLKVVKTDQNQ